MPWPPGPTFSGDAMTEHYNKDLWDINDRLHNRALDEGADYVTKHFNQSPCMFKDRDVMAAYMRQQFENLTSGVWLEFGVWSGTSINYYATHLPSLTFHGFDSFRGLPEDWSSGFPSMRGTFDLYGQAPVVLSNVTLHSGWFDRTLPLFVFNHSDELEHMVCLYIDSDLYSSCNTVLSCLQDYIKPGLLILFDEYLGYPNWKNGEFKAWQKFCKQHNVKYRYRAFHKWMALVEVI